MKKKLDRKNNVIMGYEVMNYINHYVKRTSIK